MTEANPPLPDDYVVRIGSRYLVDGHLRTSPIYGTVARLKAYFGGASEVRHPTSLKNQPEKIDE